MPNVARCRKATETDGTMTQPSCMLPKPRPRALDKQARKKRKQSVEDEQNKLVKARSGGQCEVVQHTQVIIAGFHELTKVALRCTKKAVHIHHILNGMGRRGVRVNCVSPATVETPGIQSILSNAEFRANEEGATALGRLAQPDYVAHVVAFLLSEEASYLTGIEILCDGGYSLAGQTHLNAGRFVA